MENSASSKHRINTTRRQFCKTATLASGSAFLPFFISSRTNWDRKDFYSIPNEYMSDNKSIIGAYGPWLAQIRQDPGTLSFRNPRYTNVEAWKQEVMPKVKEYIARPQLGFKPEVRITRQFQYDGLHFESMEWSLPYGRPTRAILIKPLNYQGRLPGILGLHDHGGNKYFGHRKITKTGDDQHPMMKTHQEEYYEGNAWANEIARRGYAVLVHDVFTFASRRVRFEEMGVITWGEARTAGRSDTNPEDQDNINTYNNWAAAHEHVMAKSLFCGGTTWPGMFLIEDQLALTVLASREEVDEDRLGCAGLSGGGLRTDFLGGLDERIKCAVSIGFMSTWDDFMLHKSYTHTWMTYVPVLPAHLEFPEILGLRMPLPTMIQSTTEDQLYTLPEMQRAAKILEENFAKADASDALSCRFYPGPHKFDRAMQKDAFDWFDRWLK